jgi:phosphate-selective porin OprO/OprP
MRSRYVILGLLAVMMVSPGHTQTSIEQRMESLEQELRALRQQLESDREAARQKPKESPTLIAAAEGFALRSADGSAVLKLRGYVQADSRWFLDDGAHNGADTFVMRRVRPIFEGTLWKDFDFRLMPDFGNDSATLYDAYVEWKHWPWLKARAGKFKPPVGLERLQSATDILFVERAFPTSLVPSRDVGVQLGGDILAGVIQYQAGVFNGAVDGGNGGIDNGDGKDLEARLWFEPFKKAGIEPLQGFGFGVAGTIGNQDGSVGNPNLPSFRTPGQNVFFRYLSGTAVTNTAIANGQRIRYAPQAYYYWGPLGLLGEYYVTDQEVQMSSTATHLRHTAWQIAGSVVLTGEKASLKGVTPRKPFGLKNGGWGAWEFAGRYSVLRVDPDAFPTFASLSRSAQEARAWAVGLNWYLNRNIKLVADYEQTEFDGGADGGKDRETEHAFFTRAQIGF